MTRRLPWGATLWYVLHLVRGIVIKLGIILINFKVHKNAIGFPQQKTQHTSCDTMYTNNLYKLVKSHIFKKSLFLKDILRFCEFLKDMCAKASKNTCF
jgi:hypothetical protein